MSTFFYVNESYCTLLDLNPAFYIDFYQKSQSTQVVFFRENKNYTLWFIGQISGCVDWISYESENMSSFIH